MRLERLISTLPNAQINGYGDIDITNITDSSRRVKSGSLFVAIKGFTRDSQKYIEKAIKDGAAAIVGEKNAAQININGTPYIKVTNSREALGLLAATWFGHPSQK